MWQNESNVHFLDYIISSLIAINVIADSIKLCHLPRAFCPRQDFEGGMIIFSPFRDHLTCGQLCLMHQTSKTTCSTASDISFDLLQINPDDKAIELKVQPDSKLVWVIDRDFCQATKSRTKTLFFGSDNSFAGNISMPTQVSEMDQKEFPIHYVLIQKRLLDYSIFIPSKLGLPLYQSDY